MWGSHLKKGLSSLFILLFFSLSILPLTIGEQGQLDIIYVDDDNVTGPWDGSYKHPFQFIQDGINVSKKGDTVFVYQGFYQEHLSIPLSILLKGEDKNHTIIDGGGNKTIVHITCSSGNPGVNITGFSIQNGSNAIKFSRTSYYNSIQGNRITNHNIGIYMDGSYLNEIANNAFSYCYEGVHVSGPANVNIFQENIFQENNYGIRLYNCDANEIVNNLFLGNVRAISLKKSSENWITRNIISKNHIEGNSYGVFLEESNYNTISRNNFIDNDRHASFANTYYNSWRANYWDVHLLKPLPKVIAGKIIWVPFVGLFVPWINIDCFAKWMPYSFEIEVN